MALITLGSNTQIFIVGLLLFLYLSIPLLILLYFSKRNREKKKNKETELQLLREQNELLKSLVDSNKGEE